MGEVAKALSLPASVDWQGQAYPVSPCSYEVRGQFELWLEAHALNRLSQHRGRVDPEVYQDYVRQTTRDVNGLAYTWGTETCQSALGSVKGVKHLAYLCLKKAMTTDSPEITPAVVDKMFEDEDFQKRLSGTMRALNEDPNQPAPAQPGNPSPS